MNELLEKKEYDFLKTNPNLESVIYLVLSGSRAYGTSVDTSDYDLRGVLLESPKYLYGLNSFEQFEDPKSDTVIYGLKKFASLLVKANPNALELLGVNENSIVQITDQGRLLRNNADLFLSKRVINSFGSYALSQLRRLQNALCRDAYTTKEQQKHLQEVLTAQMDHFQRTYTDFPDGAIIIYNEDDCLKFDIRLSKYPISDFVGIYSELTSIIKSYQKLNHRNNKKSETSLNKHAMHLIRLLLTGTDILNGKGIITNRGAEHDLLMSVRNGNLPFNEVFDLAHEYKCKFETAAKSTQLPDEPDIEAIQQLMIKLYAMC
jgi:predicted nucleotidyltransferase